MKSILFLVALFFLCFGVLGAVLYSMGDGDNQGRTLASITIEDAPEEVFKWVSNPKSTSRWIKNAKKAKKLSKGELKVGSLVRETIKIPNATAELTGEIVRFKKNKTIQTRYYVSGMKVKRGLMKPIKRGDYAAKSFLSTLELTKLKDNQTKVTYQIEATYGRWYTRFLEPLVTQKNLENMKESLASLKKKIETSRASRVRKNKARERRNKERKEKEAKRNAEKKKARKDPLKDRINIEKKINIGKPNIFKPPGVLTLPQLKPMLKLNPDIQGNGK